MDEAKPPRIWLVTDERMGEALWPALGRLPAGRGVLFRHHASPDRLAIGERVASLCAANGLVLSVSRDAALASRLGATWIHNPPQRLGNVGVQVSRSVHSLTEARGANRRGTALAFVSPLFPTRSHPGASVLARREVQSILAALECPAIALGGMSESRFRDLDGLGFYGWAGIDAWIRT